VNQPHNVLLLAAALVAAMSLASTASAAPNALTAEAVKRNQDMQATGVTDEKIWAALNAGGSVSSGMTAVLQE